MSGAVVLLSGGMDSSTLLHYVRRRLGVEPVYALTFLYGQKHAREVEAARWQAAAAGVEEHHVVDLSFLWKLTGAASALTDPGTRVPCLHELDETARRQPPTYVPHRNLLLLALAAATAEARNLTDVYYGAQRQDAYGYWDCSADFVARLNATLALNRKAPMRVHAPFLGWSKADEIRLGMELGVNYSHTWTCYVGETKPCGGCPACEERAAGFRAANLSDPLMKP